MSCENCIFAMSAVKAACTMDYPCGRTTKPAFKKFMEDWHKKLAESRNGKTSN